MHVAGKSLKKMHDKLGTKELARLMGCTPRNVYHMLRDKHTHYRFRRSGGKWHWIKYQEGQEVES